MAAVVVAGEEVLMVAVVVVHATIDQIVPTPLYLAGPCGGCVSGDADCSDGDGVGGCHSHWSW